MTLSLTSKNVCKILVIFLIVTLGNSGVNQAQTTRQKQKAKTAKKVYKDIVQVARDSRKQPAFKFVYNTKTPYYNAFYNPQDNTINIGEGVYDVTTEMGKDSLNALASVIGHELAHFYKDHGWGWSFGLANKDLEIAKKIYKMDMTEKRRVEMETEADYFGGIFGYLAGYNTLGVNGKFLKVLYKKIGLEEKTPGYPSLTERLGIARNTQKTLKKLVPVFDAANYLTMIQSYDLASACYDYIGKTFPSREIYNNAGVALALQAVKLFDKQELKYFYPFGLDTNTRLHNLDARAGGETKKEKRQRLLEEAQEQFKAAIRMDKNYAAGYINLALVNELLGERDLAIGYASKAAKLAKKQGLGLLEANALIAKGIAKAKEGATEEAEAAFTKAQKRNPLIARINLKALKKANQFGYGFEVVKSKEKPGPKESIAEADLSMLEVLTENAQKTRIRQQADKHPAILLKTAQEPDEGYEVIEVVGFAKLKENNAFLKTSSKYEGKTARGIKIGDSLKQIMEKYGVASKQITGVQNTYLIYQSTRIIFMLNAQQKLESWMLYLK